jgi:hypothetical protein
MTFSNSHAVNIEFYDIFQMGPSCYFAGRRADGKKKLSAGKLFAGKLQL